MHCTTRTLLSSAFGQSLTRATTTSTTLLPPTFLAPALATQQTTSSFSTSSPFYARKAIKKDANPARGVSALRRTGLKKQKITSITPAELPKPVLDPALRSQVEVDPDHGLWEFFPSDRKSMATPEEMNSHGRGWYIQELRHKDWDDLHRLWWVCIKEVNRLKTYAAERNRAGNMYGQYESSERRKAIQKTMKSIKFVLTERWYTWENARVAAMQDEEINMYADLDAGEEAYLPKGDGFEVESASADTANPQTTVLPLEPPKPELKA